MSQKTAETSVSSLSHSQSLQRPSQIKTVVTVPRTSLFGGSVKILFAEGFCVSCSLGER